MPSKISMNVIKDAFMENQDYSSELCLEKKKRPWYYRNKIAGFSLFLSCISLIIAIVALKELQTLNAKQAASMSASPISAAAVIGDPDQQTHEKMMKSIQEMNITLNRFLKYGDKVELCSVGIKTGLVKDSAMSASSIYGPKYRAQYGRLDRPGSVFGFWHPNQCKAGQWLQVDLRTPTRVTGVVTQGRSDDIEDWVTGYKVAYGNSADQLQNVQVNGTDVIFDGNTDMHTHKTNMLPQPITARYFRIIVQTWTRCIAMRMELLTC